jgi:adenine/guanine phosphoribosyltransferase-like PRPP-binding protein
MVQMNNFIPTPSRKEIKYIDDVLVTGGTAKAVCELVEVRR